MEILKTVGEMVALSQEFRTNKRFVSALVRRRPGTVLPMELDLNLGMRKYAVLITDDRGEQTRYRPDLGRFELVCRRSDGDSCQPVQTTIRVSSSNELRSRVSEGPNVKEKEGPVERSSCPEVEDGLNVKLKEGPVERSSRPEVEGEPGSLEVEIRSSACTSVESALSMHHRVYSGKEVEKRPAMVERGSHAGRPDGSRRDRGNVVERSSHVVDGPVPPRMLVRGPTGRSELRGWDRWSVRGGYGVEK